MAEHKIETKVDGKTATLVLTDKEVKAALSVCEGEALEEVIIMKKPNGGALFYTDGRRANAAQERHGFDYAFTVAKKELLTMSKAKKATEQTK